MIEIGVNSKAFIDSFGGLIPCIIVGMQYPENYDGIPSSSCNVTVKVTAKNSIYERGKLVTTSSLHIVPRKGIHAFRIPAYRIEVKDGNK